MYFARIEPDGVLHDHQGRIYLPEGRCIFGLHFVWRIQENDVSRQPRERRQDGPLHQSRAVFNPQRVQVLPDRLDRSAAALQENAPRGATAERFDPHCSRAGVRIQKDRASHARREHIEERFAQPIGRGPRGQPRNGLQPARPKLPANHSHQPTVTSPYCRCQWSRM
jgi:hypothetical protein